MKTWSNRDLASYDQARKNIFYPKTDIRLDDSFLAVLQDQQEIDLARYFPFIEDLCRSRWGDLPTSISSITIGGTYHLLYHVFYDKQSFIIRLNRLPDQHIDYEFLIDQWAYSLLEKHGLLSAKIIDVDFSRNIIPTDYEIMTYIEGQQLSAFCDRETQYMDPVLLASIGEYVARVHQIKLSGFGPLKIESLIEKTIDSSGIFNSWDQYIFLRLNQHVHLCQNAGAIDTREARKIIELFASHAHFFNNISPVLLHGDLGNHNFISSDGTSIAALIDWEDCMSGDPVFDVAFWGTFFRDHMLDDFLVGYKKITTLSADFLTRYWLYYLRIALSKTVHRIRFNYKDHPSRPPASLRIQKALSYFI